MDRKFDVIAVGSGPAGLLTTTYLCLKSDLKIAIVAPVLNLEAWHCTYCCWKSTIENSWIRELTDHLYQYEWDAQTETTSGMKPLAKYCQMNNQEIMKACFSILHKSDQVTLIENWADSLSDTIVNLRRDGQIEGDYILDCTGPYSMFQPPISKGIFPARYQTFYGESVHWPNHGLDFNLMDYSLHFADSIPDSFAYILPLSKDSIFIEETILVHDDKVPITLLKDRFLMRLKHYGMQNVDPRKILFKEEYAIPMGGHLPPKKGPIRIGACGKMTHPATGYCFSYTVNQIPALAQALVDGKSNEEIWNILHSDSICYYWHCFGQEILNQFSRNSTLQGFFTAVFNTRDWYAFMTRQLDFKGTLINAAECALYFDFYIFLAFIKALFIIIFSLIWRFIKNLCS